MNFLRLVKPMLIGLVVIVFSIMGLETVVGVDMQPLAETFHAVSPLSGREWIFSIFLVAGYIAGGRGLQVGVGSLVAAVRIGISDPITATDVHTTDGAVEVEGTAEPVVIGGETTSDDVEVTLTAPASGEDCVAYTWEKQEQERSTTGDDRTSWQTTGEDEDAVPFYVADESGRVAVDPTDATLSLDRSLEREGFDSREYEGRLHPGDDVHVYGYKREVSGADDRFAADQMYVTDRLGDEPVSLADHLSDVTVFIGAPSDDGTFKISDAGELRTTLRSVAKGIVCSLGGLGLLLGATFGTFLILS